MIGPKCIDCYTRDRISPYLFGFWICDCCRIKRGIKLHEEFLQRQTWTKKERCELSLQLKSLRETLKLTENGD